MSAVNGTVTVTTNPTLIVGANSNRRGVIISNNSSTAALYCGVDATLTVSNGIVVPASGTLIFSSDGEVYKGDIYGVVDSSTNNVRYMEWTP